MERIYFIENSGFLDQNFQIRNKKEEFPISDREIFFKKLEIFCTKLSGGANLFNIGNSTISAKNYVGIINYKDIEIQILPKVLRLFALEENDEQQINTNKFYRNIHFLDDILIFMLHYVKDWKDIYSSGTANQKITKSPFLEIFIRYYAKQLYEKLIRYYRQRYESKEENLSVLKGKILWNEHIKRNYVNKHKIYQQYDEYNENHLLYIIFKCISLFLFTKSKSSITKKLLNDIIFLLADVDYFEVENIHFDRISFDRQNCIYKEVFELGKALYYEKIPSLTKEKNEFYALYFDMNKLFEEFIFRFSKPIFENNNPGCTLQRKHKPLLFKSPHRRSVECDIVALNESNEIKWIYDVKNRLQNPDYFSSSDYAYQMISYSDITEEHPPCQLIYQTNDINENIYNRNNQSIKNPHIVSISEKRIYQSFISFFEGESTIDQLKNKLAKQLNTVFASLDNYS